MASNHPSTAARKRASVSLEVLNAKSDIQDVLYRVAERSGLPTKAADHALQRYVDEMFDDMLAEAAKKKRAHH